MVLSDQSAVGEIWHGHAMTVDPTQVGEIVDGWRRAFAMPVGERVAIQDAQYARLREFHWGEVIRRFIDEYESLG
jgi:hypothetical protein